MNRDKDTVSGLKGENNDVAANTALSCFPKAFSDRKSPHRLPSRETGALSLQTGKKRKLRKKELSSRKRLASCLH